MTPQQAVQQAEGRQHGPRSPWRPRAIAQWHSAGYVAAMEEVGTVARDALARHPDDDIAYSTGIALCDVLKLVEAVLELHDWEGPES